MHWQVAVLVVLVVTMGTPGAVASDPAEPKIVTVHPNPVYEFDDGEYIAVTFPAATDIDGWTITDGYHEAALPSETVQGVVAFSLEPEMAASVTEHRVLPVDGQLQLANAGDTIQLRKADGSVVDEVRYHRASDGDVLRRTDGNWEWEAVGVTDRDATRLDADSATAFALPDEPDIPVDVVRTADDRVLLAGYSFTSRQIAAELEAAVERGVAVRVLVDDGPVGGISERQARVLDSLVDAGVDVQVFGGDWARYSFHHAKYAVVDDRALVLSENWKPAGTGGQSSRGWGVVVDSDAVAAELAAVFRADANWRDTKPWQEFRFNRTFDEQPVADGEYPTRLDAETTHVDAAEVIVAPDNAETRVTDLLASANETIYVKQVSVGSRTHPFLQAALDAARDGVSVRILLSNAWYVADGNRELATWLNEKAASKNLPVTAKLADPRSRFDKVHAKGVVVDGNRVLVGSINWNNHSVRENREVAVILHGDAVATYYERVFRADWRGGAWQLPVTFAISISVAILAAGWYARRSVEFDGRR